MPTEIILLKRIHADPEVPFTLDVKGKSGGKTGSFTVLVDGQKYQYKPSIVENSFVRRFKANFYDTEIFNEILAARVVQQFDLDPSNPRVPSVFFVTDPTSPYVGVVSKYLEGDLKSLDVFLEKPADMSHIKLVSREENFKKGIYCIDGNFRFALKKELAEAIALSALCGDADVNPGNMLVIEEGGTTRLARIDFGHAFRDLMRYPRLGGKREHPNNIIDFFNREYVDGFPSASKSKLWRDYPGLILSKEMVLALKSISAKSDAKTRVHTALEAVKTEIEDILKIPKIDKVMIVSSLQSIAAHISGEKIDKDLKIEDIFAQLEAFFAKNIKQMNYVADIIDLQLEIKKAIADGSIKAALPELNEKYKRYNEVLEDFGPFTWIKEKEEVPAFKGTFEEYVHYQESLLVLNNYLDEVDNFLLTRTISETQKKLVRPLKSIIDNPFHTVKQKFDLLDKEITKIVSSPERKTHIELSKLITNLRSTPASVKREVSVGGEKEILRRLLGDGEPTNTYGDKSTP